MTVRILIGDCRERLRELPDNSVQCCVTSPPYFGLRDYGHAGQMGLEPTPDEYVAGMVALFREVRRVLRPDGTLWLNLGDSYAQGGSGGASGKSTMKNDGRALIGARNAEQRLNEVAFTRKAPDGLKPKDLIGIPWRVAFALQQPFVDWQIKSEAMRGWVAGIVDGEGCITIQRTKSSHSESLSFPPIVQVRMCDREPLDKLVAAAGSQIGNAQHPPSQVAVNQRPSWQWKVSAERAAQIIAEIYPFLTCKRRQAIVAWNHQQFRTARGNQSRSQSDLEREEFCKGLINDLNQRRSVDLPSWMIEPKVIETPGWYLRQDLIWNKPNPMPESVRDRCTKAHEYIFLLSKEPRYHYDAEAIAEAGVVPEGTRRTIGKAKEGGVNRAEASGRTASGNEAQGFCVVSGTRNKRSVWTVATQPFSGAHFATFPPDLIEPCILAGCQKGGTILDPFFGAGTTGLVADRLQRDCIGIELNPDYAALAMSRLNGDGGMFSEVKAA